MRLTLILTSLALVACAPADTTDAGTSRGAAAARVDQAGGDPAHAHDAKLASEPTGPEQGAPAPAADTHGDHPHAEGDHSHAEPAAPAPGGHDHSSPHGGQIADTSGGLHLELVADGTQLRLHVLDRNVAPVPVTGMTASLLVQPTQGTPTALPLVVEGDHFVGASPLAAGQLGIVVATVKIDGISRTARFTLGDADPHAGHSHGGSQHSHDR